VYVVSVCFQVFSAVFILEAVLKIICLNKYYFMNGWNVFDLVIVVASIVDLGVENVQGLSVLRTFRLVSCSCCIDIVMFSFALRHILLNATRVDSEI
jgi:hypothetical protein